MTACHICLLWRLHYGVPISRQTMNLRLTNSGHWALRVVTCLPRLTAPRRVARILLASGHRANILQEHCLPHTRQVYGNNLWLQDDNARSGPSSLLLGIESVKHSLLAWHEQCREGHECPLHYNLYPEQYTWNPARLDKAPRGKRGALCALTSSTTSLIACSDVTLLSFVPEGSHTFLDIYLLLRLHLCIPICQIHPFVCFQ